jgi:hypothetical protein
MSVAIPLLHHKNGRRKNPKKVLNGKIHNRRSVGKPRTRWEDVVQRDALKVLEIQGWGRRYSCPSYEGSSFQ